MAVELNGIAKRFGGRWVLRGATLSVRAGEVVAILGRNGSGKTTLLRIIATLLRPTRGTGVVLGFDLARDGDAVRQRVALLGHTNAIYPDLTAVENLAFALRMLGHPADRAVIDAALGAVGLESEADTRVRSFSAGMQRRLALARVGLLSSPLLLLDEPYSSLDPEGAELVTARIARMREDRGAVIVVTHDVVRARRIADRVVAIDAGRITPCGPNDHPFSSDASEPWALRGEG